MQIETLEEIKKASQEALKGRKKLESLHDKYMARMHSGGLTRAATTTYNANTADIVTNIIEPNEKILKALLK
jgi:hypothetical protein